MFLFCRYSDLDGGNRHIVLESLPHLYAITLWEDWIYWSDWNIKTVERANRFTGLGRENVKTISQQPFDIHVVQEGLQPDSESCFATYCSCIFHLDEPSKMRSNVVFQSKWSPITGITLYSRGDRCTSGL